MKLHLPSGLRAALLACITAIAGLGTTLSTAALAGGIFTIAFAGQAAAEVFDLSTVYMYQHYTINLSGDNSQNVVKLYTGVATNTLNVWEYKVAELGRVEGVAGGEAESYIKDGAGTLIVLYGAQQERPMDVTVKAGTLVIDYNGATDGTYNWKVSFAKGTATVMGGATLQLTRENALGVSAGKDAPMPPASPWAAVRPLPPCSWTRAICSIKTSP